MAKHEALAPVVSVLNMKGGVGKTTISAHVFRELYRRLRKSTLLVDFDPQFNLTQTIVSQADYEKYKLSNKTILSIMEPASTPSLFKISTELGPPPDVEDVCVVLKRLQDHPDVHLSLVAGDFGLVKYSLINDSSVLNPIQKRFLTFIAETRKKRGLICLDCNPSSSFMTICSLMASTHVLVPVRPDRYSILGLEMLEQFINELTILTTKPKIVILLNGVRSTGYDPSVENSLRSHPRFGPVTLSTSLRISKLLEASQGYTGFATDKKQSWRINDRIATVIDELGVHLGIK